jgi:hypothetical protein
MRPPTNKLKQMNRTSYFDFSFGICTAIKKNMYVFKKYEHKFARKSLLAVTTQSFSTTF